MRFNFVDDGEGNYGFLKADGSFFPFRSGSVYLVTSSKTIKEGVKVLTYDLTSIPNYKNLTTDNIMAFVDTLCIRVNYDAHSGGATDTMYRPIIIYDASTGIATLTMNGNIPKDGIGISFALFVITNDLENIVNS